MDIRTPVSTIYGDWLAKWGEIWKSQIAKLQEKFGGKIEQAMMPGEHPTDVPILYVQKEAIVDVLRFMKEDSDFGYEFLSDLTATDEHGLREPRFDVVYNLYAIQHGWRIRLKCKVADGEDLPSAIAVWPGANWPEREVWDMFGIKFRGHPDLRRILMDERWQGHPLRKDYPLRGYQLYTEPQQVHEELLD
jgi:NADH-quinone oxidoreductase subunit C